MRKTLAVLIFFAVPYVMIAEKVKAADVSVAVSTYSVSDAGTLAPQISGSAKIEKLVVSNSSSTATMVTVYKNCSSTTTVAAIFRVEAPATGNVIIDFDNFNLPLTYTDVCFRKEDAVDYVYVSAHYR